MNVLRMAALKGWQMKHWSFLTGLPTSGTKADFQRHLLRQLEQPPDTAQSRRVVSVDMGIRNLAFCAVDTPSPDLASSQRFFTIHAWQRMDLLRNEGTRSEVNKLPPAEGPSTALRGSNKAGRERQPAGSDSFTPAAMARTALAVTEELLSYTPDALLIERQRFRSGGAAAIQEWTVRVNMLESMLYACLETLSSCKSAADTKHPQVIAISPARVATFWSISQKFSPKPPKKLFEPTPDLGKSLLPLSGRQKVDKKEKIDIVRSWISGKSDVQLAFTEGTAKIASAFERTRDIRSATELAGGKLDDLADCLLQAIAWAQWRENERKIKAMWETMIAESRVELLGHN